MLKKLIKFISIIIGLFVLMSVVMFAFNICPPEGPWPMPPWCDSDFAVRIPFFSSSFPEPAVDREDAQSKDTKDSGGVIDLFNKPVFLTRIDQVKIPMISTERLASHYANAIGWQGLAIENVMFRMGSRQLINTAHSLDMPVIASMNVRWLIRANPIDYVETATLDLHGNPIKLGDYQQFVHGTYWRNLLDPKYQEMLLDDAKANIDVGVSGIIFDDDGDGMPYSTIYNFGGSFDDYSMAGFRDYLKSEFTNEELKSKFNIQNIEDFHFGEYIIENNLKDTWNKNRQDPHPLTHEFQKFLAIEGRNIMKDISDELKAYAKEEHNRDLIISFNNSPIFIGKAYSGGYDIADILYGEHFWFHKQHFKGSVAAKMAESFTDKQFLLLLEINIDRGEVAEPLNNAFKYAFADVYSTGNTSMQIAYPGCWTLSEWEYIEPLTYDDSVFEHYSGFMQDNRNLFGLNEPADIAVVQSLASRRLDFLPIDRNIHNGGSPDRQFIAIVDMLLNLDIPFHTVLSGEGMLGLEDTIKLENLSEYELIILPNVMALEDSEVDAIIQYARNGGKVIQINDFGVLDINGERVNHQNIGSFAKNPGRHTVGEGIWIKENWGNRFEFNYLFGEGKHLLPTEQSKDNQQLQRLNRLVNENVELDISVDGPLTLNVRRFIDTSTVTDKDESRIVLHLVNYDYDIAKDEFTPSGPVEIKVDTKGLEIQTAILHDIEKREKNEIPFEIQGDNIKITVPNIYVYSILELIE